MNNNNKEYRQKYWKEYYKQNGEKLRTIRRLKYQEKKKELLLYQKNYYEAHKDQILQYQKEYREINTNNLETNTKKNNRLLTKFKETPWMISFYRMRYRIKSKRFQKRNLTNTLTEAQTKELWFKNENNKFLIIPSLDRINPKLGYTLENCQFIEWAENFGRQYYPDWEIKLIPKIRESVVGEFDK